MSILVSLRLVFVAAIFSFSLTGELFAEDLHFKTPEDAIHAYIDAVVNQDFKKIIYTTAVQRISRNYDYVSHAVRLRSLTTKYPMPTSSELFIEINRSTFEAQIARQIQLLANGIMATNGLEDGTNILVHENGQEAVDYVRSVQANRLAEISIIKIGIPDPNKLNSDVNRANWKKYAAIFGADDRTERLVLLSFGGLRYMVGFSLFRYGDDWLIESQSSTLVPTGYEHGPKRVTSEEFEQYLQ